ncbi:MAG: hypothetical protein AAF074_13045 [Pseudomonadota bacterium]
MSIAETLAAQRRNARPAARLRAARRPLALAAALAAWLGAWLGAAPAPAATLLDLDEVDWSQVIYEVEGFPGVPLFEMPRISAELRLVQNMALRGNHAGAVGLIDRLLARFPYVGELHASRSVFLALTGEREEALTELRTAIDLGYDRAGAFRNARARSLAGFAELPGFRDAIAREAKIPDFTIPPATPAVVTEQRASVGPDNTRWLIDLARLRSSFTFPPRLSRQPPLGQTGGPESQALARLVSRGAAAGLAGVLYDNRDDGHSSLKRADYPRLSFVDYGPEARAQRLHYGLNQHMLFDAPVIGNSSTALTAGPFWRSQPRSALTTPFGPARLAQLYAGNHIYVFPEHRDHDPAQSGGRGDVLPANTPYYVLSQGSSGTDRAFLDAVAHILAAMKPETRRLAERRGLLAPTVQMVLRRGMAGVADDPERYLAGAAHPSVFDGAAIDLATMIDIAHRLTPETLPPVPRLAVLADFEAREGIDYFGQRLTEALFTTPYAVGRIWRAAAFTRRVTLDVSQTPPPDPGAAGPLRFHWKLLRGDPDRVRIRPLDPQGRRAAVEIDWQTRGTVPGRPDLTTDRVDIGVFADNGVELSAPGFFSVLFPARQARRYGPPSGEGGQRLLERVDYAPAAAPSGLYEDPVIFPRRDWVDEFAYDAEGAVAGWTRRRGDRLSRFTKHGYLIREFDAEERPVLAERVAYPLRRRADGTPEAVETPTGKRFEFIYTSDTDRIGTLVPLPDRAPSPTPSPSPSSAPSEPAAQGAAAGTEN